MMLEIIKLLQADKWYGVSRKVDEAKGLNRYCSTYKQIFKLYKRVICQKR